MIERCGKPLENESENRMKNETKKGASIRSRYSESMAWGKELGRRRDERQ